MMTALLPFAAFVGGLILLLVAGDVLTDISLRVARKLGFRPIVIALTLTALATSMPEIFITALAALDGQSALALGNVAGSNISNHWLVFGLAALIAPLVITAPLVRRNSFFALGACLLVIVLIITGDGLSRLDGLLLLLAACLWFFYLLQVGQEQSHDAAPPELGYRWLEPIVRHASFALLTLILIVLALAAGAQLTLYGAQGMAMFLSLPDAVIGLTALAIGTSLPELATSIAAARRKQTGIIVGNLLGSTFLNCTIVLGLAALLYPIPATHAFIYFHFPLAAFACLCFLPFALLRYNPALKAGGLMLAFYAAYVYILFFAPHYIPA